MRRFEDLPPLHPKEVRCHEVSCAEAQLALAPVTSKRKLHRTQALVGLPLAGLTGYLAVEYGRFVPRLDALSLPGDPSLLRLVRSVALLAPAVVAGVVGLWGYFRQPSSIAGRLALDVVEALGPRVSGPVSLSAYWGVSRPEPRGDFEDVELALWGQRPSGTRFVVGVEVKSSHRARTHYVASGAGVTARRRSRGSASTWLFLELPPGAPEPRADERCSVTLTAQGGRQLSRNLGARDCTALEVMELVDLVT